MGFAFEYTKLPAGEPIVVAAAGASRTSWTTVLAAFALAVSLYNSYLLVNGPVRVLDQYPAADSSSASSAATYSFSAPEPAHPQPQPNSPALKLVGATPHTPSFELPYQASLTRAQLVAQAAKHLNVRPEYIVLYNVPEVGVRRENTTALTGPARILTRRPENRILPNGQRLSQSDANGGSVQPGSTIQVAVRPIRGDHIHYAFDIFVRGKRLAKINDRKPETFIYEGEHLKQLYPHFGLHAGYTPEFFKDKLIHVHQGTAWYWFGQTEGFGANLGQYLENIGVWVWEDESLRYPLHRPFGVPKVPEYEIALDFPIETKFTDGTPLESNIDWDADDYALDRTLVWSPRPDEPNLKWRLYYYSFYNSSDYYVLERDFERVWLHENQARIVLAYDDENWVPPAIDTESIYYLEQKYGIYKGFDGLDYPSPNRPDWKSPKF